MASTVNTNISSLTAQRNLSSTQAALASSMQRLSSGLRINSAKDDAAGLAISERMTAQIRGLNQASRNAADGISVTQLADGALGSISGNLQRIRELAVQSANATNSVSDRLALQAEVSQLSSQIDRIGTQTELNGIKLLDGTYTNQQYQVGPNAHQTISVSIDSAVVTSIGSHSLKTISPFGYGMSHPVGQSGPLTPSNAFTAFNGYNVQENFTISGNGTVSSTGTLPFPQTAKSIAQAMNVFTSQTGVTASGSTIAIIGNVTPGSLKFEMMGVNTISVVITAIVSNANDLSSIADAINAQTSVTAITAVANQTGQLVLTNDVGEDIRLCSLDPTGGLENAYMTGRLGVFEAQYFEAPNGGTSQDAITIGGSLSFNSSSSFTISTDSNLNNVLAAPTISSTPLSVAAIDVSTVAGANNALWAVDGALASISSTRAQLGALQNRFVANIENLQTNSDNLSASRSRIQDADFAMETANLSRAQILQQAGMAMVAQANQVPQTVLALLR